ncbi:hypothetical protein TspCOW1_21690 [Thiohalobacter sp. COW1]|nr:hypothetical protein TspCOW1_21690 [Thiohalobacter sp. COW1]
MFIHRDWVFSYRDWAFISREHIPSYFHTYGRQALSLIPDPATGT